MEQALLGRSSVNQSIVGDGTRVGNLSNQISASNPKFWGEDIPDNDTFEVKYNNYDLKARTAVSPETVDKSITGLRFDLSDAQRGVYSTEGRIAGYSVNSNINTVLSALKSSITSTSIRTMFALEKLAETETDDLRHFPAAEAAKLYHYN